MTAFPVTRMSLGIGRVQLRLASKAMLQRSPTSEIFADVESVWISSIMLISLLSCFIWINMIQFYLNLETFDFMKRRTVSYFSFCPGKFSIDFRDVSPKSEGSPGWGNRQTTTPDKPWWYFSCHQEEKKVAKTIGSHHIDLFGSIWGYQKMYLNSLNLSGVFMLGILVYHTLNYYHMLQWDSERNHGSNVETYRSIAMNACIYPGMNIYLQTIFGFARGTRVSTQNHSKCFTISKFYHTVRLSMPAPWTQQPTATIGKWHAYTNSS